MLFFGNERNSNHNHHSMLHMVVDFHRYEKEVYKYNMILEIFVKALSKDVNNNNHHYQPSIIDFLEDIQKVLNNLYVPKEMNNPYL